MWMRLRSPKMNGAIFGFQKRVWWPKCTPASSIWRMDMGDVDIFAPKWDTPWQAREFPGLSLHTPRVATLGTLSGPAAPHDRFRRMCGFKNTGIAPIIGVVAGLVLPKKAALYTIRRP